MSYPFNKSRSFFNCPSDCPQRKPACQSHCRTYLDKKEEWDASKAAERANVDVKDYVRHSIEKTMDSKAKRNRSNRGIIWFRKR